ncbi:MAG: T9SS C-terminal target domain-containing protein [Ignavibacteria bacterium]|nr:MAG: T9SS C-terminal target domain-containing protein [Ignavibacteria bacterium]
MYLGKMDAPYSSGSVPTSNINITPTLTSPGVDWLTFGIAPDGRLFLFGTDGIQKYVAYSDDETTWTEFPMGINGVIGPDVGFGGDSSSYHVYTSAVYSNNKGEAGTWQNFGDVSFETHPNDGAVFVDPINDNIVLLTTDQGLGVTENGGPDIVEIDEGIEAVQVIDFDMTDSKYTGWLASKSGIRKVADYLTSPTWSFAMFPTGDGSPYSAVAIDRTDTTTVYAGNVRVYKTTDDGTNWTRVFTPESAPYNLPGVGTSCLALEVLPEDHNIVFAGFEVWGPDKGGLFYSTDAGATWDQILIEATTNGQDVDVTDVIFNVEGSDTVAYVSVLYDLGAPQGYSVYKLTKSGSTWTPSQDMSSSGTSVGYSIVVSLLDLELSVTGDTVYACGTDAGINEPHVYYKPLNTTGLWTPFTSSGLPTSTSRQAFAVTVGSDTVFTAVDHEIYYWIWGSSSSWSLGYSYPIGTKINVLYYDELLVGTDLGFYGHSGVMLTGIKREELSQQPEKFELMQNYPNPFNPSTNITYIIPEQTEVTLKIYNLLGKEIAELVNENQQAGRYTVSFDASNLASGIYFYKLKAGNQLFTRKMMLIK